MKRMTLMKGAGFIRCGQFLVSKIQIQLESHIKWACFLLLIFFLNALPVMAYNSCNNGDDTVIYNLAWEVCL